MSLTSPGDADAASPGTTLWGQPAPFSQPDDMLQPGRDAMPGPPRAPATRSPGFSAPRLGHRLPFCRRHRRPGRGLAEEQWVAALAHPSRTSRESVSGHWLQRQPATSKALTAGLLSPRSHSLAFSLPTANQTWTVLESYEAVHSIQKTGRPIRPREPWGCRSQGNGSIPRSTAGAGILTRSCCRG